MESKTFEAVSEPALSEKEIATITADLKLYYGAPCYFMEHGQCINFIPGFLPGV